jgi:hypothetical protein
MSTAEAVPFSRAEEQSANSPGHAAERRGAPRFPLLQRCFAHPADARTGPDWQVIAYNISITGIGIALPCPVELGTELEIEAWKLPRAPRLRARVVHTRLSNFLWFCGCELFTPLTEEQLSTWLAGPTDWVPKKTSALGF